MADDEPDEPIVITDHVVSPAPPARPARDDGPQLADHQVPIDLHPPGPTTPPATRTAISTATSAAAAVVAMAAPPQAPLAHPPTPVQSTPSFLRRAERTARWHHPAMRAGLWAAVLLLALALVLQMALLWRDSLAAHVPRSTPLLQSLCRLAGCSVLPLRRIQQLSVTSSGLNRLEGSSLYRLQLVLHNRADTAVMVPALALLMPQMAELGVAQAALQAGQDLPIKVLMSTGERRVEGYTLELFYP